MLCVRVFYVILQSVLLGSLRPVGNLAGQQIARKCIGADHNIFYAAGTDFFPDVSAGDLEEHMVPLSCYC